VRGLMERGHRMRPVVTFSLTAHAQPRRQELGHASFSVCQYVSAGRPKTVLSKPGFDSRIQVMVMYKECVTPLPLALCDHSRMSLIFHPLLALIASATDRELAKYIQFLKEENKILRARIPGQVHTKPVERERLIKF